MRPPIGTLDGKEFEVVIIGAGVNGASASQHLAAAGYNILLVDKNDFGSGSSSRSSRIMHCGLRYLAPGASMWEFVRHPGRLKTALRMARLAMQYRSQFVTTTPERSLPVKWFYPIYKGGPYPNWQVDLAYGVLKALGPKTVPLDYRRLKPTEAMENPLVRLLRDADQLTGVGVFREYLYEWPERICVDTVMDAERMGAVVRNYTAASGLTKTSDGNWRIALRDSMPPHDEATVTGKVVLNTGGIWIDDINAKNSGEQKPGRKITGTKGVCIVFQLPDDCQGQAITVINRANEPINLTPWRGMHYFGPTETVYEGDIDNIKPLDEEIDWLLDEVNYLFPGMKGLKRQDIIFTWAGVRPLTYDPALPKGNRSREIHDLGPEGMANVLAMTAGPIMTHRSAGKELLEAVRKRLPPSGTEKSLSFAARLFPDNQNSPRLLDDGTSTTLQDLRHAAAEEHPTNLADLLFRRVGVGWTRTMGAPAARRTAETVADILGWDEERIVEETSRYEAYVAENHRWKQWR
jgi:glycerol-3-phosphate dehydrogenase